MSSDSLGIASIVECTVLLLLFILYFVLLVKYPEHFDEFTQLFNP